MQPVAVVGIDQVHGAAHRPRAHEAGVVQITAREARHPAAQRESRRAHILGLDPDHRPRRGARVGRCVSRQQACPCEPLDGVRARRGSRRRQRQRRPGGGDGGERRRLRVADRERRRRPASLRTVTVADTRPDASAQPPVPETCASVTNRTPRNARDTVSPSWVPRSGRRRDPSSRRPTPTTTSGSRRRAPRPRRSRPGARSRMPRPTSPSQAPRRPA